MEIIFVNRTYSSIGTMIISSLLKREGFKTSFVDADYKLLRDRIKNNKRVILAYYATLLSYGSLFALNLKLKSEFPDLISVFGGPHPTYSPEIINDGGVDGVCIGEGEYAMLELVRNISDQKPITHIHNWWIKKEGEIYKNPLRPLVDDLDTLPFPDRSCFKIRDYPSLGKGLVVTSRGCPYKCTYCHNEAYNRLYGNPLGMIRHRSVDNVVEEIKQMKTDFRTESINFVEENFVLDMQWLEEFSSKYNKETGLPFSCRVRPDLVTTQIIDLLKKAGCRNISIGIESGNDYFRNEVFRRNISRGQILNAAKIITDAGIYLTTYNIVGIPNAPLSADMETLELNIRCKPHICCVYIFFPFPNTESYNYAKKYNEEGLELYYQGSVDAKLRIPSLQRKFKDPKVKKKCRRFQCLFTLIVKMPFLFPLAPFFIKFPISKLGALFTVIDEGFIFYLMRPKSTVSKLKRLVYYFNNHILNSVRYYRNNA